MHAHLAIKIHGGVGDGVRAMRTMLGVESMLLFPPPQSFLPSNFPECG